MISQDPKAPKQRLLEEIRHWLPIPWVYFILEAARRKIHKL